MPITLLYLVLLLAVICLWFMLLKRPIYEAIAVSFLVLLTVSGRWGSLPAYLNAGLSSTLIYSMTTFAAMSVILKSTGILDESVNLIMALLGRVPGGAGYVAVLASAFMGALSGSGPANVMATGAITIPAMKRSGFPAELAANVESNASYLGNMIPPSSNIVAALGALTALYPTTAPDAGRFWILMWGVSLWFILQRLLMVFLFCRYYKIRPLPREERPALRTVLKRSWKGLLVPVVILLPFLLDYLFKDSFFTSRLGKDGAKAFSSSLLLFIGGAASLFACFLAKEKVSPTGLAKSFAAGVKSIAPAIGVCVFGYMISALFADLNVAAELELFLASVSFSKLGTIVIVCILACFLGMVIPGSSLVVIFGSVFISTLAAVGVDPVLCAAMLPCICGVMCGITPPLALGLYAGMTLAESDYGKTVKNDLWWVFAQFALEVIVLMGFLPILGL